MLDLGSPFILVMSWAILGLVVSIPLFQIVRAWSEGTIDALSGLGLVGVIFTLIAALWKSAGTIWMLLFIVLLLGVCFLAPLFWTLQNKRENADYRDGKIEKCREALKRDPNNSSAHAFLGDALMEKKSYVAAIAQYEEATKLAPHDRRWQVKLKSAQNAFIEQKTKNSRKIPLR